MTEKNGVERSTATDVLRRMLDERGVEWQAPTSFDGTARYDTVAGGYWFHEFNGKMTIHGLTPAQAIAATLGSCNCSDNCMNSERTETCHDMYTDDDEWFACSECNTELRVHKPFGVIGSIRFCPNCGAKVIEPTTNDVDAEVRDG